MSKYMSRSELEAAGFGFLFDKDVSTTMPAAVAGSVYEFSTKRLIKETLLNPDCVDGQGELIHLSKMTKPKSETVRVLFVSEQGYLVKSLVDGKERFIELSSRDEVICNIKPV